MNLEKPLPITYNSTVLEEVMVYIIEKKQEHDVINAEKVLELSQDSQCSQVKNSLIAFPW